jgi:hypothetical protein
MRLEIRQSESVWLSSSGYKALLIGCDAFPVVDLGVRQLDLGFGLLACHGMGKDLHAAKETED